MAITSKAHLMRPPSFEWNEMPHPRRWDFPVYQHAYVGYAGSLPRRWRESAAVLGPPS